MRWHRRRWQGSEHYPTNPQELHNDGESDQEGQKEGQEADRTEPTGTRADAPEEGDPHVPAESATAPQHSTVHAEPPAQASCDDSEDEAADVQEKDGGGDRKQRGEAAEGDRGS